jgi:hypothetical protein
MKKRWKRAAGITRSNLQNERGSLLAVRGPKSLEEVPGAVARKTVIKCMPEANETPRRMHGEKWI